MSRRRGWLSDAVADALTGQLRKTVDAAAEPLREEIRHQAAQAVRATAVPVRRGVRTAARLVADKALDELTTRLREAIGSGGPADRRPRP